METATRLNDGRTHALVDCIPVSAKEFAKAPIFFKKVDTLASILLRYAWSGCDMVHLCRHGIRTQHYAGGLAWAAWFRLAPVQARVIVCHDADCLRLSRQGIDDAESEWSQHHSKRLIDTRAKGLRGSIPPNFPYFHIEFGLTGASRFRFAPEPTDVMRHDEAHFPSICQAPLACLACKAQPA